MPTPQAVNPIIEEFSVARQQAGADEEPTVFITRATIEVMLNREKEKKLCIFYKPAAPYSTIVAAKPYPPEYR